MISKSSKSAAECRFDRAERGVELFTHLSQRKAQKVGTFYDGSLQFGQFRNTTVKL